MSNVVGILPIIDGTEARDCLASMHPNLRARIVVVDNRPEATGPELDVPDPLDELLPAQRSVPYVRRGTNRGVAASWNIGNLVRSRMKARWLLLVSEAVRFGADGGLTLLQRLEAGVLDWAVQTTLGWKLIALNAATLDTVGPFDPNLWPAYYEDTDYLYRMGLAGLPSPRENGRPLGFCPVEVYAPAGDAHCVKRKLVEVDFGKLRRYYRAKWGGDQGSERHTHPFGLVEHDWRWTPDPEHAARLVPA